MARLIEDTVGKIRDLPIAERLRTILTDAAEAAGVELVRVTSGGQAKLGSGGKRTGSTRHDLGNAADLRLENGGRPLDFTKPRDLPFFEAFVARATALGATGVGAGIGYMGRDTIHVGFGSEAVWGAGGRSAEAPTWLVRAVKLGRAGRSGGGTPQSEISQPVSHGSDGRYVVVARSGLKLRPGPDTNRKEIEVLERGQHLTARFSAETPGWAQVDLQSDGLFDGYVFSAYIAPA